MHMKATKNLNGGVRAAVQAKLTAADNELRAANATIKALEMELYEAKDLIQRYKAVAQHNHTAARTMYVIWVGTFATAWIGLVIAAAIYGCVL